MVTDRESFGSFGDDSMEITHEYQSILFTLAFGTAIRLSNVTDCTRGCLEKEESGVQCDFDSERSSTLIPDARTRRPLEIAPSSWQLAGASFPDL